MAFSRTSANGTSPIQITAAGTAIITTAMINLSGTGINSASDQIGIKFNLYRITETTPFENSCDLP